MVAVGDAHTQDPSDTDSTLGAYGDVAGAGRGGASPFILGWPTRLYLLLCELLTLGRELCGTGGASLVLPLRLGRLLLDLDFCDERVVGGEDRSSHELSVDEDLLTCGRSGASPSLLEVLPEWEPSVWLVRKLVLERRRRLRSLRKEGIVAQSPGWRGYLRCTQSVPMVAKASDVKRMAGGGRGSGGGRSEVWQRNSTSNGSESDKVEGPASPSPPCSGCLSHRRQARRGEVLVKAAHSSASRKGTGLVGSERKKACPGIDKKSG